MSSKSKHPVLLTDASGEVTLMYTFSEEEYWKGIAAPKNRKAAGIDNVLVKQLNNLGPTELCTTGYLICSTNASHKIRYQDCGDSQCSTPYLNHTNRYHYYATYISSMKD